mgnify:CR=1 FL=1
MAGYYDKNKDYSKELQRTDLSSSERDRLTKERENKIADKYGGKEPNMIGSNKTYSQTYDKGGNRRDSSPSGGGSSQTATGGTPYIKGPGYGTGGYTTPGIYGAANLQPTDLANYWKKMTGGADMSRRPDLAGGYSISNGYTVFYDENGYAKKAVKGVADYTPHQDINAGNGSYGKSGAWTDNEMMSALDRSKIQDIRNRLQRGEITGDQANQAANAIRAGYGYTIDKNGYVTDSGALSSVNDLRRRLGLDVSPESAELAYYRYLMGTDTSPSAQVNGKVQSFGDYLAENGGVQAGTSGYGTPAYSQQRVTDINAGDTPASNFTAQTGTSFDIGDGSDYLKELYAKKVAAELAALKSAYEQNTATLDASRAQIAPVYDIARNSAANQNALSRGAFQEMAVANGLNTGTTGQAALAQDVVLQQNLSQIDREQAEKTAAIDLQRSQLDTEYRNAIAKAEATGDAELANALYEEYVRQQNLYAKYGGQTGGSGSGSTGGSTVVKPTLTASQVQSALKNGIVTDDVISAFDYYYGQGAYDSLYGTGKLTSGGSSGGGSTGKKKGSYSNGSLTNQQVKQLQKYYGVSQDGKWGANSKKAAGGLTADQAWAKYQGGGSSGSSNYGNIRRTITGYMSQGNYAKAQSYLKSNWNSLTEAQQKELSAMFG